MYRILWIFVFLGIFTPLKAEYLIVQGEPVKGEYPLNAVVQVKLQKDVATIADAFSFLLRHSPYRFVLPKDSDPAAVIMIQPILASQREFGPMPLYQVLSQLLGPHYQLVLNPETRELTVRRLLLNNEGVLR